MWRKSDCGAGSPAKRHGSGSLAPRCLAVLLITLATGCTGWREYLHNGCKVGPAYVPPAACVAEHWIDAADIRTEEDPAMLRCWWTAFNDPTLNELVAVAYRQNLSLRGRFPDPPVTSSSPHCCGRDLPSAADSQRKLHSQRNGRTKWSGGGPCLGTVLGQVPRHVGLWLWPQLGAGLLGAVPPAIAAADANLDASVADYDDVLVTLLGDVAVNYVVGAPPRSESPCCKPTWSFSAAFSST